MSLILISKIKDAYDLPKLVLLILFACLSISLYNFCTALSSSVFEFPPFHCNYIQVFPHFLLYQD